MPIFGQMTETLSSMDSSIRMEDDFFSVAMTMPFVADPNHQHWYGKELKHDVPLIPRLVVPCATTASACSICTSLPLGEKTVSE
jgi:hypothetical protein